MSGQRKYGRLQASPHWKTIEDFVGDDSRLEYHFSLHVNSTEREDIRQISRYFRVNFKCDGQGSQKQIRVLKMDIMREKAQAEQLAAEAPPLVAAFLKAVKEIIPGQPYRVNALFVQYYGGTQAWSLGEDSKWEPPSKRRKGKDGKPVAPTADEAAAESDSDSDSGVAALARWNPLVAAAAAAAPAPPAPPLVAPAAAAPEPPPAAAAPAGTAVAPTVPVAAPPVAKSSADKSVVSTPPSSTKLKTRPQLLAEVFDYLDPQDVGCLGCKQMMQFAVLNGFDSTEEEWNTEYRSLCHEWHVNPDKGFSFPQFSELTGDDSDKGCECSDSELRGILRKLPKTKDKLPAMLLEPVTMEVQTMEPVTMEVQKQ